VILEELHQIKQDVRYLRKREEGRQKAASDEMGEALNALARTIERTKGLPCPMAKSKEIYESHLTEIGRIATTWAKFDHWIDQAIWILAEVDGRKGACLTSQINSIHIALMVEANRPQSATKFANKLSEEAAQAVQIRNSFAHGPLDMGINLETRELEIYMRRVHTKGKTLSYETTILTKDELDKALKSITDIYLKLVKNWSLIVGASSIDELAPPHTHEE
jgi:hypothetical protein